MKTHSSIVIQCVAFEVSLKIQLDKNIWVENLQHKGNYSMTITHSLQRFYLQHDQYSVLFVQPVPQKCSIEDYQRTGQSVE